MKKILFIILTIWIVSCSFSEETSLSENEKKGILLLREEEKLARDVYTKLYEIWNTPIFNNIAKSERTHMDRIGTLIETFHLTDPVQIDRPGVFENQELQEIYDSFVETGRKSLYDALYIGATVEDLDIYDLENLMEETENEEILFVYTSLRDGSVNHINAFNRQLIQYGDKYKAQFISESYLVEILK